MSILRINILLICCVLFFSCGKEKDDKTKSDIEIGDEKSSGGISARGVQFKIKYDKPRQIYKIESIDLNNNGKDEVVVLSVIKEKLKLDFTDFYNFDMIQVFALDSSGNNYVKILSDTVDYSVSCNFQDLQNDGRKQVLIKTNTGGNNPLASSGLFVYNMNVEDSLELIKYLDFGDPEVMDINNDGVDEIVVKDYYWGIMTHIDVINFVKDIYAMEKGELVRRNSAYEDFFDEKINEAKKEYDETKSKIQSGIKIRPTEYPLYSEAVEIAVNYWSKNDGDNLKKFWDEEYSYLKSNLPEDQFIDLQNFVLRVVPLAKNI
jgi:hypothetical protein